MHSSSQTPDMHFRPSRIAPAAMLATIPSIDIFGQSALASNSPAGPGTASLRLRGLCDSRTPVRLDGRRLPVNALHAASGAGAAFDIGALPVGAIERVEILKDGASAICGADAVHQLHHPRRLPGHRRRTARRKASRRVPRTSRSLRRWALR